MKKKGLLILGAAFALTIAGCSNASRPIKEKPFYAGDPGDTVAFLYTTSSSKKLSTTYGSNTLADDNNKLSIACTTSKVSGSGVIQNTYNSEFGGQQMTTNANRNTTVRFTFSNPWMGSNATYSNYTQIDSVTFTAVAGSSTSYNVDCTIGGVAATGDNSGFTATKTTCTFTPAEGHNSGVIVITVSYVSGSKGWYFDNLGINASVPTEENPNPTYRVSYTANGATSGNVPVDNGLYHEGDIVTVLGNTGNLAKPTFIFSGWNDGTNDYQPDETFEMGTEDVTLTAQWTAGIGLSYDANGGSNAPETTYVVSGETQIVASASSVVAPSGKQFKEWNTASDGSGISYNPNDEITNFTSSLELFAIWEDQTSVTITAGLDKWVISNSSGSTVKSDITLTCSNTIASSTEFRFYKNSTVTISRAVGKIESIEFTGVSGYAISNLEVTSGGGTLTTNGNNGTWEGAAQTVVFTASAAQARATEIVVNYYMGADVDLNKTSLELTVNGSSSTVGVSEISGVTNPTYEWTCVSGDDCVTLTNATTDTVTVAPKGTIFATCLLNLTVNGDNLQSPIVREVSVAVTRASDSENPYNVTEAKRAIDWANDGFLANAHVQGIVSYVHEFNDEDKWITYWISEDGTRTNELQAFKGKGLDNIDFESISDIDLGASVVIKGNLAKYGLNYELNIGNYLVSYSISTETKVEKLNTQASLSYKYTKNGNGVLDTLTNSTTGVSGNSYTSWSNKQGASGAIYAGQSAGDHSSIQLRSNNSNSGVITTTSGGLATKVSVVWNSNTENNRVINVYGKHTAYSAPTDLYITESQGDLIGTIKKGESTELAISDDYEFIGIRSNSGALYLDKIDIQWGEPISYTFSNVAIRFGGSITPELWNELDTDSHNIEGFGVAFAKAEDLTGQLKDTISNVETARGFYKSVNDKAEGHPDLVGGNYVWNLYLRISTVENEVYTEDYLNDDITAVAYIKLKNGEVVFLKQTTASVSGLASALIADTSNDYTGASFEGSLGRLASL